MAMSLRLLRRAARSPTECARRWPSRRACSKATEDLRSEGVLSASTERELPKDGRNPVREAVAAAYDKAVGAG